MNCSVGGCGQEALTELRLRYVHDDGESQAAWEPLCASHAGCAAHGWLPVAGMPRPVRYVAQRPLEDHEHDYRLMTAAPDRCPTGGITGYTDMRACRCGDRRLA
jgi:hypothetical protein